MSAQHTPGRIVVRGTSELHDGDTGKMRGMATSKDDAHRFAACWNACEGLSTEALEKAQPGEIAEWGKLAGKMPALMARSNELLEMLMRAADWHSGDKWRDGTPEERRAWQDHKDLMDAAIAKATGQEGGAR